MSPENRRPAAPAETRRFRVLKVAPTSFFSDYGCHVRIYEETLALQRLGNKVAISTYASGNDLEGLEIHRIGGARRGSPPRIGSSRRKILYDPLLALSTARLVGQFKPDIIHAHLHEGALIGWLAARLRNVPLVFDFQGSMTREMLDHQFIRRDSIWFDPLQRLERLINRLPDAIITSSRNAADVLNYDFNYPANKIYVMADMVDTNRFLPRWDLPDMSIISEQKRALRLPLDRRIVVYLGLLAPYQGTDRLLQAARQLRDRDVPVHFLIMGYPNVESYVEQVRQLGLQSMVTFTGRIPYAEAPSLLPVGDIAISPKISETEGNGKLLNYMAVGLPTIAFDGPVAREILGDVGVLAKMSSETSLGQAIEWLVEDDSARNDLARRTRERAVARFDWQSAGRGLMELYGSLR